jgi:hypothetical protein
MSHSFRILLCSLLLTFVSADDSFVNFTYTGTYESCTQDQPCKTLDGALSPLTESRTCTIYINSGNASMAPVVHSSPTGSLFFIQTDVSAQIYTTIATQPAITMSNVRTYALFTSHSTSFSFLSLVLLHSKISSSSRHHPAHSCLISARKSSLTTACLLAVVMVICLLLQRKPFLHSSAFISFVFHQSMEQIRF